MAGLPARRARRVQRRVGPPDQHVQAGARDPRRVRLFRRQPDRRGSSTGDRRCRHTARCRPREPQAGIPAPHRPSRRPAAPGARGAPLMHRVLVTAVGGNIGQGVVKALRAGSRQYFIAGTDMEPRSAGFFFVDRASVTPAAGADGMAASLTTIVESERIEAIYVCSPQELAFFGAARSDLERRTGARVLVNPEPVIRIGQDKLETARFLGAHGFPYPDTVLAADDAAVGQLIERWGFPVIVKPRSGWTSVNVFTIRSRAALEAVRVLVPDLVVQRHLPDPIEEYTAGVVGSSADRRFAWII